MIRTTCCCLLALCTAAGAQGQNMREEMQKRMEEISRLMRESERLLLEITKVDRLVAKQEAIVRELEGLEKPPPKADAAAAAERQKEVHELRQKQTATAQRLAELFDGQRQRGERTVLLLQDLLKNWPRSMHGQQGQPDDRKKKSRSERERERRLQKQGEQKQHQPNSPRDKKDLFSKKRERSKRRQDKTQDAARLRQVDAWIAKLPPAEQERINRGDLSNIPSRYRRLVREYTALRAKRDSEREEDDR